MTGTKSAVSVDTLSDFDAVALPRSRSSSNLLPNFALVGRICDIDDAISEAKDDQQRKEEAAKAEKIAYALEYFTKKSPDILRNMQGTVSQLDPRKFAAVLREELKKAADEMAREFKSKIEPTVKRAESADRRKNLPNIFVYIYRVTYVWLIAFLIMVIYANFKIKSDDLTALIVMFFVFCFISIIAVVYISRKYKW